MCSRGGAEWVARCVRHSLFLCYCHVIFQTNNGKPASHPRWVYCRLYSCRRAGERGRPRGASGEEQVRLRCLSEKIRVCTSSRGSSLRCPKAPCRPHSCGVTLSFPFPDVTCTDDDDEVANSQSLLRTPVLISSPRALGGKWRRAWRQGSTRSRWAEEG